MEEPLHTIRLKTGSFEFELTSDAEEVAKARAALEPLVLAAFSGSAGEAAETNGHSGNGGGSGGTGTATKRKTPRKRSTTPASGGEAARAGVREKLLAASAEGFPNLPTDPGFKWRAYGVMSWAGEKLGIDGLTAQEIQAFLSVKRKIAGTYQGYASALERQLKTGEVELVTPDPRVFRLMKTGEDALTEYLADAKTTK